MSYRSYNFSTEPSTTSRFSTLNSSSSYRPSFSSGSYRSPRTATTATAPSSTVSSFISRYSNLAADKEKERERDKAKEEERRKERELREREREKERDREKERLIETSKKLEAELKESKPAPLKKSSLIAAKYGSTKDVSTGDDASTKSGASGKAQTGKESGGLKPKKDTAPPVTFTTRYGRAGVTREQSREPSPATRTNSSTSITQRSRQRDPSPVATTVTEKARSRDPSPAVEPKRTGGYALAIASKLSGSKVPQQSATNEYRRQSSGTRFAQNRARSRDPSPTVRTRTSREPSPMEQRRLQLANKMIATAARSRDPSPAPVVQQIKQPNKQANAGDQKQRFTSSISITTGAGARSRDPSPAESRKIPSFGNASKLRSRDPSPTDSKRQTAAGGRLSRAGNQETGLIKPSTLGNARKARDPSPAIAAKVRSRDPSPATVPRRASREPSPAESVREKYGLGGTPAYRPYGRTNSGLGGSLRFGAGPASPVPKSPIADLALSYMTSSEAIAARTSRPSSRLRLNSQSREPSQCSSPLTASQIFSPEPRMASKDDQKREGTSSSETTTTTSSSSEESSEETESSVEPEPKIFIEVTLVTRGTSPTPPGATPLIRARRAEMCKTIEKTIQKQLLPVETADKQIQSDRMDDSTKYLRYGQPSTRSWSPFIDQRYGSSSPTVGYTRYSSASSRYSRDSPSLSRETSVSSSKSDAPEKRELSTLAARVKELSLSKSNSTKSTASRTSTASSASGKQKTPPKQKSPEKPPPAPAKDSPSPVRSVANKDFRKSALNMGPAPERPRKSSTSSNKSSSSSASTATPVAEANGSSSRIPQVRQPNGGVKVVKRSDRSASTSSEDTSSTGGSSGTDTDREQSITRMDANDLDDASGATDASNANNELLMRAIQLATNFVNNQNRNATSWYDNASTTSMSESLPADASGKSGWEAGTHYMESIKDDSSNEEDDDDEGDDNRTEAQDGEQAERQSNSEYQQASWWRRSGNFEQTATVQESVPSARSFTYRIRRVESGEKPWWLSDEGNKPVPELQPDSPERTNATQDGAHADGATDDGRTTATSIFESQTLSPFRPIRVTRIESGERAWWMKSTENVAAKTTASSGEASKQPSKEQTPDSVGAGKKCPGYTVFKLEAEDEAWWEQAMADLSGKEQSSESTPTSTSGSREPSKEPTPEPRSQGITLTRVTSGEKAWWLYSSDKVNELTETTPSGEAPESNESVRECSPVKAKPFKITRIESGEQPWWMLETSDGPVSRSGSKSNIVSRSNSFNSRSSGKQTSPTKYRITRIESGEKAWWMAGGDSPEEGAGSPRKLSSFVEQHGEEEADLQTADIEAQVEEELQSITNFVAGLPKFPTGDYTIEPIISQTPPLGDRASPEGVEDNCPAGGRTSPYDNIPSTMPSVPVETSVQSIPIVSVENSAGVGGSVVGNYATRKETQSPVFISRHTNIDDLLGGSCHPLSPMMDRMFIMDDLQEITPKDVRVHDSTPQFIDYGGNR
uniref:FHOD1 N-terminal GTPase-binding domain-containing protein n=1 Tax=Anopheles farauti TaxID=69004 RepID=A0A182QB79_9DIPT